MVALILVNFAAGRLIEDAHGDERRAWLILALACDVGSLFYFKYMGWFLENLGRLTNTDFSFFRVALPLGVSFYVFQSIAYVADVYRGDAEAERSLLDYAAFQAMFPQLVMGPILRLRDVSAELSCRCCFWVWCLEDGQGSGKKEAWNGAPDPRRRKRSAEMPDGAAPGPAAPDPPGQAVPEVPGRAGSQVCPLPARPAGFCWL